MLLPRLRFFVTQALFGLWRSAGVTALSVVTIGVALAILSIFFVVVTNLSHLADTLGKDVELSVYLVRDTSELRGLTLAGEVEKRDDVAAVEFVTSTVAMGLFEKSLGRDAIILEGLPADVLPPSLEVRLTEQSWSVDRVREIADELGQLESVEDVRYGQEDISRLNALLSFARLVATILGVTLSLAVILIVSNTIRLAVYSRRDEIEIMSLIGATDSFVRAPFVIEGAIEGLLGGVFACVALASLKEALVTGMTLGLSYAYAGVQIDFVPSEFFIYALLMGAALGFLGSIFAVGKFVRV